MSVILGFVKCKKCNYQKFVVSAFFRCEKCGCREYIKTTWIDDLHEEMGIKDEQK